MPAKRLRRREGSESDISSGTEFIELDGNPDLLGVNSGELLKLKKESRELKAIKEKNLEKPAATKALEKLLNLTSDPTVVELDKDHVNDLATKVMEEVDILINIAKESKTEEEKATRRFMSKLDQVT